MFTTAWPRNRATHWTCKLVHQAHQQFMHVNIETQTKTNSTSRAQQSVCPSCRTTGPEMGAIPHNTRNQNKHNITVSATVQSNNVSVNLRCPGRTFLNAQHYKPSPLVRFTPHREHREPVGHEWGLPSAVRSNSVSRLSFTTFTSKHTHTHTHHKRRTRNPRCRRNA